MSTKLSRNWIAHGLATPARTCQRPELALDLRQSLSGQKVIVTGAAGFIGSEIVHQLANMGATVIAVDNLHNGKRENLADILSPSVTLVVADIRDHNIMRDLLGRCDIVLHLACLGVRHSIHSPLENHEINATATLHLLELSREASIKRFVYVSSSEVYGTARYVPMVEEHPLTPNTVYGASKLAGERYTDAYWRTYGMDTVVVRPFNAFGPRSHHEGDSGEVIPKFMLQAIAGEPLIIHGDGSQTRDFTDVRDTARGILLAAGCPQLQGTTLNLGQGKEITINELAELVGAVVDRNSVTVHHEPPRPGDVLRLCADTTLANNRIGYAPLITLKDGLLNLRNWYLQQERSPTELLSEMRVKNWTTPN